MERENKQTSQRDVAISLMEQNLFGDALPIFLNLAKSNPDDWGLFYMAGQCCRFTEQYAEAINLLEKAADMSPNEAEVFVALGVAFQLSGDYTSSLTALERVLQIDPKNWNACNSMGLTYRKKGDTHKAIELYIRAGDIYSEELARKNIDKYTREEVTDEGKRVLVVDPIAMEKVMNELLRSEPWPAYFSNNIGICYLELGDFESAKIAFEESIEFTPDGFDYPAPQHHLELMEEDISKDN